MPLKPVLLMLFLMAGCMPPIHADAKIAAAVPVSVKNVNNCYKLSRELYRSAQPDDDGFKALEKQGIKSVLNLREYHRDDNEAQGTSLNLYRIRLAAGKVTAQDLMECLLLIDKAPKPILVHCWHGSDRTGIVCAAYRIVIQGWSPEKAEEELKDERFGHHKSYYSNLSELLRTTDWEEFKSAFRQRKAAQAS